LAYETARATAHFFPRGFRIVQVDRDLQHFGKEPVKVARERTQVDRIMISGAAGSSETH
jgi:hypothetical protein